PNYKNDVNLNKYLTNGATSCGIDCSGLSGTSFNADEQKLMPDFNLNNQNAKGQRQAFKNAENNNTGYLDNNFSNISQGDIVFNGSATHVMVATGQSRINNGKTEIQITHSPQTGREVVTEWSAIG